MTTYSDTARLFDEVQEAHKRLMHARLARRRAATEEAAANAAYAEAVNALLPPEPAKPFTNDVSLVSTVTTYTGSDLAQMRRPWQARKDAV